MIPVRSSCPNAEDTEVSTKMFQACIKLGSRSTTIVAARDLWANSEVKAFLEMLAMKFPAHPEGGQVLSPLPTLPREAFAPFVQFIALAWFPTGFFLQSCGKRIEAEISAGKERQHSRDHRWTSALPRCFFH